MNSLYQSIIIIPILQSQTSVNNQIVEALQWLQSAFKKDHRRMFIHLFKVFSCAKDPQ